jgi:hypothetical protein
MQKVILGYDSGNGAIRLQMGMYLQQDLLLVIVQFLTKIY